MTIPAVESRTTCGNNVQNTTNECLDCDSISSGSLLRPGISVVVPVFNSEGTLRELVSRLEPVLRGRSCLFELILVNDCSRDSSWNLVQELSRTHQWIRGIDLMRNYGQHNALLCGIRAARYDTCVTMDDDLQNPPEEIPLMLARLAEGFDVVYGTAAQLQHGVWRNLASRMTKAVLSSAMGAVVATQVSAFRVFRSHLRVAFNQYDNPLVSIDVLLTWATTRFASVQVNHVPRAVGASNYNFRRLFVHAMNMMTGYSTRPLRLAIVMGFVFSLLGLLLLTYVVGRYLLYGGAVPGFSFLASVIVVFAGAQMFILGIMGEYLARMYLRTMSRPAYVIRATPQDSSDSR